MNYGQVYLTKQGRNLLAYCMEGHELSFTDFKLGSGKISGTSQLFEMEDLINPKSQGTIRGVKSNLDGTATISISITNENIEEGFLMSEFGLYAYDPRFGEILYAVASNDENPDFVPASNHQEFELLIDIIVVIASVSNLTINIDKSMIFATIEQLEDLAGFGRTNQTVKNNWDLIRDLDLRLLQLATSGVTNIKQNQFKVSFDNLSTEEQFEGIFEQNMKRLVI